MADRFPLIANSSSKQIQEIPNSDNLNLSGNNIVGVVNITSTGTITGTATTAQGLTGSPNITVGSVTGTTGSFSGSVSIGGTLTYEDVTNVDSVGIITARSGVDFSGTLKEQVNITAGKLSDNLNINLDNGMVHHFTTAETTTSTPNIMSATGINTDMATGDTISVTIITTAAAGGYSAQLKIDGSDVTEKWVGGSAPSAGGSSGLDIYAYNIIKTGSAAYTVIANLTNVA